MLDCPLHSQTSPTRTPLIIFSPLLLSVILIVYALSEPLGVLTLAIHLPSLPVTASKLRSVHEGDTVTFTPLSSIP